MQSLSLALQRELHKNSERGTGLLHTSGHQHFQSRAEKAQKQEGELLLSPLQALKAGRIRPTTLAREKAQADPLPYSSCCSSEVWLQKGSPPSPPPLHVASESPIPGIAERYSHGSYAQPDCS